MIRHVSLTQAVRDALESAEWTKQDLIARLNEDCNFRDQKAFAVVYNLSTGDRITVVVHCTDELDCNWAAVARTEPEVIVSEMAINRHIAAKIRPSQEMRAILFQLAKGLEEKLAARFPEESRALATGKAVGIRWAALASIEELNNVEVLRDWYGIQCFEDSSGAFTSAELFVFQIWPETWETRDTVAAARFWKEALGDGLNPFDAKLLNGLSFLRGFLEGAAPPQSNDLWI